MSEAASGGRGQVAGPGDAGAGEGRFSGAFFGYLAVTAMISGGLVMVIEVLGSRVIGPFFGVSLFVWTSLITVTLVALALGYAAGGLLSDRKSSPDYLYGLLLASGLLVLLIPPLKGAVLKACFPLGLRLGALASSLVLFGPPLLLLGCVSPYIVKIAAREMKNLGRTVGFFYAISTMGSFVGTVVTGFVLIAYVGVDRIFAFVGLLLISLAAVYFALFRRRPYLLVLALLPFLLPGERGMVRVEMADGAVATRVLDRDTFYGNVKVIDYARGGARLRELLIDGQVQGGIDLSNGLSLYEYAYFMQFLPRSINPSGRECLVIGLGAGVVPAWYERLGVRTDVVDINPDMPAIARDYFGFALSGEVAVADARYYLATSGKRYDYLILDVFNGDTTPGHLLSLEAFRLMKERLSERGVLGINMAGSLRERTFMTASILRTLGEVFATVEAHPIFPAESEEGWGNLEVIAYDFPPPPSHAFVVADTDIHPSVFPTVKRFLDRTWDFPPGTPAVILTDDYNPIDFYDVWLKEKCRRAVLEHTPWDLLI